jgi:hypothetical protein
MAKIADRDRVKLARDGYTILHFPIIVGIVVAALGVEDAMAHVGELQPVGAFSAGALLGGSLVHGDYGPNNLPMSYASW